MGLLFIYLFILTMELIHVLITEIVQVHIRTMSFVTCFMAHALNKFYCRGTLGTRVNPDTIGCM